MVRLTAKRRPNVSSSAAQVLQRNSPAATHMSLYSRAHQPPRPQEVQQLLRPQHRSEHDRLLLPDVLRSKCSVARFTSFHFLCFMPAIVLFEWAASCSASSGCEQ